MPNGKVIHVDGSRTIRCVSIPLGTPSNRLKGTATKQHTSRMVTPVTATSRAVSVSDGNREILLSTISRVPLRGHVLCPRTRSTQTGTTSQTEEVTAIRGGLLTPVDSIGQDTSSSSACLVPVTPSKGWVRGSVNRKHQAERITKSQAENQRALTSGSCLSSGRAERSGGMPATRRSTCSMSYTTTQSQKPVTTLLWALGAISETGWHFPLIANEIQKKRVWVPRSSRPSMLQTCRNSEPATDTRGNRHTLWGALRGSRSELSPKRGLSVGSVATAIS